MKKTTTKAYEALARDIANSPVIDAALPPTTDRYDHAILEEDNRRLSFFQLALKIEMLCDAPKEWANQYGQILADVTESTIHAFQCRFEDMDKKTRAAMFDIAEWPAERHES